MDLTYTNQSLLKEESYGQGFGAGPVFDGLSLLQVQESELSLDDKRMTWQNQTVIGMMESLMDALRRNCYCLLQTSQFEHMLKQMLREADQTMDFVRPYAEFETAYLGDESSSKVWWFNEDPDSLQATELKDKSAFEQYMQHIHAIQDSLASALSMALGCSIDPNAGPKFFRRSCGSTEEHQSLKRELVSEVEPTNDGAEKRFLDFIQRRRLCMMYVVNCTDSTFIELHPRDEDYFELQGNAKLSLSAGQLLIFRHDMLSYTYSSEDSNDLVLQSWFLEEPRSLQVNKLVGGEDAIAHALNGRGAAFPHYQEVHITGAHYRCTSGMADVEQLAAAMMYCVDGVLKMPLGRWDIDLYYHPEGDGGKCWTQHGAFVQDDDVLHFDNEFFGMEYELAEKLERELRPALEVSYAIMHNAGYDFETMRNQPIDLFTCTTDGMVGNTYHNLLNYLDTELTAFCTIPLLLQRQYGFKGRAVAVDTACSASNVASNLCYQDLRIGRDARHNYGLDGSVIPGGLIYGSACFAAVGGFIGLAQAHMVGKSGRAKTYDMSADGMQRGEVFGGYYMTMMDSGAELKQMAQILGGAVNQDGRSASLTAPNGPSQTKVLLQAAEDSGRGIDDTTTTELHGTGTALGDPIETGSTRALMFKRQTGVPILHSSGKSNTNHNELAAGVSGIMRQLFSIGESTSPANQHIRVLNSNIDYTGYPALWPNERIHVNLEYVHNGVSSFGFGGTNARLELWGHVRRGVNKAVCVNQTDTGSLAYIGTSDMSKAPAWDAVNAFFTTCSQCLGTMCWTCGEATDADDISDSDKHQCHMVRSETAGYDICSLCYKGAYMINRRQVPQVGDPLRKVYMVGDVLNAPIYEEMKMAVDGAYVHTVSVGEGSLFHFNIALDADPSSTLYPVVPNAAQNARVLGPDSNARGRSWMIDASSANLLAGGEYEIRFRWVWGCKFVSWKVQTRAKIKQDTIYYIVSSLNDWEPQSMLQDAADESAWETSLQIGKSGEEKFQFSVQDGDQWEAIYPNGYNVADTSVRIMGPACGGHGQNWSIDGKRGETVNIKLKIDNGHITMSIYDEQMNTRTWTSLVQDKTQSLGKQFFIVGTWNEWWCSDQMQPAGIDVYVWQHVIQDHDEEFQIVVDEDWSRTLHPNTGQALRIGNSCHAYGPNGDGHGLNWKIAGPIGATVEIFLNLNLEQDDRIPTISCKLLKLVD